jgi:Protein kinase domain
MSSCPSCGGQVAAGSAFCSSCGAPIDSGGDETRLAGPAGETRTQPRGGVPPAGGAPTPGSGWLSSSGSIDHGRFAPGTVLDGRYRIIGLLGRGGMGEVYRADDLRLGQPVALKFLPADLAQDARRLAQFHNEVRMARQVSHPNVCRVYDIGEVDGQLFLSMEFVDGEDLAASLRRVGRFPEERAIELARQIAAGLAAAHDRGVVHRDLKPANIMIDGTGRARLMDFGLAAVGEVGDVRAGTPAYMAPEQIAGREVTPRSDIYALGLVLYELFTGRRAFTATTLADLVEQQQATTLTSPTEVVKGLDPAIDRAILRCLDPDPSRRPASAFAVAMSLPGGDPLAAAIAAGETPSPEMVAASGGEHATLKPLAGLLWLTGVAVLLVTAAALADRTSVLSRVPPIKPTAVLADRADQMRRAFGYTEPVRESAFGFYNSLEYHAWGSQHGAARSDWPALGHLGAMPVRFWYRTSPVVLIPEDPLGQVSDSDPPLTIAGMTRLRLDTEGRLIAFDAVPPEVETAAADGGSKPPDVDFAPLFVAAGLDPRAFTSVTPSRTPPVYADARYAWRGVLPGTDTPLGVEAASYRGRPVMFELVEPWKSAARDPSGGVEDDTSVASIVLVLVLLAVAVVLTRRNLRSGRADRAGAFRLAAFVFFLSLATWLLVPHVANFAAERGRFFSNIAIALFLAGALYVIYLALEPSVRRSWPRALVSWSRLLTRRVRDAMVGRDVLLGVACGLGLTLMDELTQWLPPRLGAPAPYPAVGQITAIQSARFFAQALLNCLSEGLQNALIWFLVFALARDLIRRLAPKLSDVWVAAVVALLLTAVFAGDFSRGWIFVAILGAETILAIVVMLRLGVFAAFVMYAVNAVTTRLPLTLDGTRIYAANAWFTLGLLFALAAAGLWMARAGEPLFGAAPARRADAGA